MIAIGIFWLAREYWYWVDSDIIWAGILILVGVGVIIYGINRSNRHASRDMNGQRININGEN
ncbi:MAG: hypothetical protein ACOYVF_04520 [Candidatus Zixiibacteriota bacterium]